MLKITAFKYRDNETFYGALSGQPLENFDGYAMIYFPDGVQMIFKTGIDNEYNERYFTAIGNKPKIDYIFA